MKPRLTSRSRGFLLPARSVALACTLALALPACIVVPETVISYDDKCKIQRRQMTLNAVQIGAFQGCANQGCVALLVAAGAVAAASAVISGSVAVIGNVAYWLEEQGQCLLQ